MSTLYLIALCGFCAVMLAVLFEAVTGVSRKPVWHDHRSAYRATAPSLIEQPRLAAAPPVVPSIEVHDVEARHSNFAGLTNNEEFELTA